MKLQKVCPMRVSMITLSIIGDTTLSRTILTAYTDTYAECLLPICCDAGSLERLAYVKLACSFSMKKNRRFHDNLPFLSGFGHVQNICLHFEIHLQMLERSLKTEEISNYLLNHHFSEFTYPSARVPCVHTCMHRH